LTADVLVSVSDYQYNSAKHIFLCRSMLAVRASITRAKVAATMFVWIRTPIFGKGRS